MTETARRHARLPGIEKDQIEKDELELERLREDFQYKKRMDALAVRKAFLEVREKRLTARYQLPTGVWDVAKYFVAVIPVIATAVGLYLTYRKDTEALRHQTLIAQRFNVDAHVLTLLKTLADTKNPTEIIHSAVALQAYGQAGTRLLVRHLKIDHEDWLYPLFVDSMTDILIAEPDKAKQKDAAEELVRRIVDQGEQAVNEFILAPTTDVYRIWVKAHLDALSRLGSRCTKVCDVVRPILVSQSAQITSLLLAKLSARSELLEKHKDVPASVERTQQTLQALQALQALNPPRKSWWEKWL